MGKEILWEEKEFTECTSRPFPPGPPPSSVLATPSQRAPRPSVSPSWLLRDHLFSCPTARLLGLTQLLPIHVPRRSIIAAENCGRTQTLWGKAIVEEAKTFGRDKEL